MRRDFGEADAQRFANPAPGPIAFHRASKGARDRESEARSTGGALDAQAKGRKVGARNADAFIIDPAEIGRAEDTGGFRKAIANSRTGQLSRH